MPFVRLIFAQNKNLVLSNELIRSDEGLTLAKRQLSKSFTVVIQSLSTRLIKPNFRFDLSHRRSTTISLETRNPFIFVQPYIEEEAANIAS